MRSPVGMVWEQLRQHYGRLKKKLTLAADCQGDGDCPFDQQPQRSSFSEPSMVVAVSPGAAATLLPILKCSKLNGRENFLPNLSAGFFFSCPLSLRGHLKKSFKVRKLNFFMYGHGFIKTFVKMNLLLKEQMAVIKWECVNWKKNPFQIKSSFQISLIH